MDDEIGKSVCIKCSWKSNYPKDERGVQTDALIVREVAVEPLESSDVQTQTDNATEQSDPGKASLMPIDRRVVQTLMNALENSLHTTFLLSRLNVFHETHHVRLSLIKQFRLQQMSNDESLIGMECGTRGRIAFLLGEAYHDSWCSHNGKLLVYRRGESSSITLPGCPSVVRFGSQGLLALATVTGQILITTDNEILSCTEAHRLAVTSLEWLTPFTLISASLDGHITTYLLKSASLEQQRSLMLRVNDLPRKIRKSNSTSKPTGITSLCVTNEKIFVGGETGAIWSVTLPELSVAVIGYDIDGIETLLYHSPYLLLISPSAKAKLLTQEGTLVHVFECDVRTARRDPIGLLLCGNNEQIFCWDVRDRCHSMQHKMPHITFAVSHERELTTVDENFAVSVYQIEYES